MRRAIRLKLLAVLIPAIFIVLLTVGPAMGATSNIVSGGSATTAALAAPVVDSSRNWTDQSNGIQEVIEQRLLYSPPKLDVQVSYPAVLDNIPYLRYAVAGTAADSSQAAAVVVCLSGLHAANNGFDYFAKQLVSKAKADKGVNIEVWALDRRVNNLEDLTGLNEAERLGNLAQQTQDPAEKERLLQQAADTIDGYYYKGLVVNGKTFQGFYTDQSAPWLAEFGLRVAMEDIYTLITTVFPDQNTRKKKVYIAGDSLGAVMTADFTCWDFDGNAATLEDAGFNNIAGVIGLDALMTPNAIPINQDILKFAANFLPQVMQDLLNNTSILTYDTTLNLLRGGALDVLLPTSAVGYVPTTYLGVEITAMLADAAPTEEATFYQTVAQHSTDPRTDVLLKICMSSDIIDGFNPVVFQKRVRWTNEALFGVVFDNNLNPITMNQSGMGFLTGGPVVEKSFPLIGNLDALLPGPLWDLISGYMPYDTMYIPNDPEARQTPWTGPLYSWVNSTDIDTSDATRYTSSAEEVTNLHDVAKCTYEGPSNLAEWYYTTRLFADIMIANTAGAEKYGLNLFYTNRLSQIPTFIRLCSEGTNIGYARLNGMYTPPLELPEYHHLDVLMADMNRDPNAKNLMYLPMSDWIKSISLPVPPPVNPCGFGTGLGMLMLGISLGLLSLAGSGMRRRRKRKNG